MPLKANKDGTYTVNWIPSVAGTYIVQIYIDSTNTGLSASCTSLASRDWFCAVVRYR